MPPVSSETRDSPPIRRPSATDSLQSNLTKDVELTLNKNLKHSAWRDSVSGIARSILLRAKDSIDTLRGASDNETGRSKLDSFNKPHRASSPAGGSLRSLRPRDRDHSADPHHASLSLRRVLTGSSRRSKRSPLLVNLMSKRSMSKLQGPEELIDDAASAKTDISPAHASLKSLSRSKHSSFHSLTHARQDPKPCSPQISPARASSPIPIPNPNPPTIDLEIESGTISSKLLFGFDLSPHVEHREPVVIPVVDTISRDHLIISSRRSKRHAARAEIACPPVPRRTSNDHWRLRRAARNRSARFPDVARQVASIEIVKNPEPMPGTNLPLEDLSDPQATEGAASPQIDGVYESPSPLSATLHLDGRLKSPRAGHINPVSGVWVSNDPIARALTPPTSDDGLPDVLLHQGLSALQQAAKDVASRQILLETAPDALSPESLRAELEAGRKALERLEQRMAGIEASLRSKASASLTPTPDRQPRDPINPCTATDPSSITSPATSPATSRLTSSEFSTSTMRSPLETFDPFYPSDHEYWRIQPRLASASTSSSTDSPSSTANAHLSTLQHLAANGSSLSPVPEAPPMGSTFPRNRSSRAARYYDIFHAAPAPAHDRSASSSSVSSVAEEAFRARTPEMLSWTVPAELHTGIVAPVSSGAATAESPAPWLSPGASGLCAGDGEGCEGEREEHGRCEENDAGGEEKIGKEEDEDELTPERCEMLDRDLRYSLGWPEGRGSPAQGRVPYYVHWAAEEGASSAEGEDWTGHGDEDSSVGLGGDIAFSSR